MYKRSTFVSPSDIKDIMYHPVGLKEVTAHLERCGVHPSKMPDVLARWGYPERPLSERRLDQEPRGINGLETIRYPTGVPQRPCLYNYHAVLGQLLNEARVRRNIWYEDVGVIEGSLVRSFEHGTKEISQQQLISLLNRYRTPWEELVGGVLWYNGDWKRFETRLIDQELKNAGRWPFWRDAILEEKAKEEQVEEQVRIDAAELHDFGNSVRGVPQGPVPAERHCNGGGWVALTATVDVAAFVGENAVVFGFAQVGPEVQIRDEARVSGKAQITGKVQIYGKSRVSGNASVSDEVQIFDSAEVFGRTRAYGRAKIYGKSKVYDNTFVSDDAQVYGESEVYGTAEIDGKRRVCRQMRVDRWTGKM